MINPQRGGEPLTLGGGPFGDLSFEWSQDRYAHRWHFEGAEEPLLASVESDSTTLWPTSPPLQQIHQQSFADGRQVIFGVGMAGRGHWSASFTLVPDLKCWIVELACRSPIAPEALLSTYRLGGAWSQQAEGSYSTEVLAPGGSSSKLQIEAITPGSTADLHEEDLRIRPLRVEKTVTTQWAFRLRVTA